MGQTAVGGRPPGCRIPHEYTRNDREGGPSATKKVLHPWATEMSYGVPLAPTPRTEGLQSRPVHRSTPVPRIPDAKKAPKNEAPLMWHSRPRLWDPQGLSVALQLGFRVSYSPERTKRMDTCPLPSWRPIGLHSRGRLCHIPDARQRSFLPKFTLPRWRGV